MDYDAIMEETEKRFDDLKPGYRFTEMYSFWAHVTLIHDNFIIVEEYNAPCDIPTDAKYRVFKSADELREHYGYGAGGYWVTYVDDTAYTDHVKKDEFGYLCDVISKDSGLAEFFLGGKYKHEN